MARAWRQFGGYDPRKWRALAERMVLGVAREIWNPPLDDAGLLEATAMEWRETLRRNCNRTMLVLNLVPNAVAFFWFAMLPHSPAARSLWEAAAELSAAISIGLR